MPEKRNWLQRLASSIREPFEQPQTTLALPIPSDLSSPLRGPVTQISAELNAQVRAGASLTTVNTTFGALTGTWKKKIERRYLVEFNAWAEEVQKAMRNQIAIETMPRERELAALRQDVTAAKLEDEIDEFKDNQDRRREKQRRRRLENEKLETELERQRNPAKEEPKQRPGFDTPLSDE